MQHCNSETGTFRLGGPKGLRPVVST